MKSTEEMLQAAVQQLQTAEQARLTSETDPARRQLLHLLYAREAAALQSMTLIRAEIPAAQKRDWKPLILPLAAAVLNLGALALWLTLPNCVTPENSGWMGRFALCIVAQSVSLCAAIGSIVSAMRRKPPKPVVVADETELRRRLVEVEGRIALDAQTIEALLRRNLLPSSAQARKRQQSYMPRCTKWHRTPGWTATQIRKKRSRGRCRMQSAC